MKTLYVSDLDGTLLHSNEKISQYTCDTINRLVNNGMIFSYATARSCVTSKKVTAGLNASIPIITYNGAFILDNNSSEILIANYFDESISAVFSELFANDIYPIVYSYVDGNEKFSYIDHRCTTGLRQFVDSRNDHRRNPVTDEAQLIQGKTFYITCIDTPQKLQPFYEKYKDRFHCVYGKDIYSGEQWLEIMPITAAKSHAILQLKEYMHCDKIIVFGDGKNDIDMFEIADECYAVENAVDELKEKATAIIEGNNEDGVAKWLSQHV